MIAKFRLNYMALIKMWSIFYGKR